MKGRSFIKIALSLAFTLVIVVVVIVAVPSGIVSAANIGGNTSHSVKTGRSQNLNNKAVSETPIKESQRVKPNEKGSSELPGELLEDEEPEQEACRPRAGCRANEFRPSPGASCRKCPVT